jgi:hypothetical protein
VKGLRRRGDPRFRWFRIRWSTGLAINQNRDRLASRPWAPRRRFFPAERPARACVVYQGLNFSGFGAWSAFCILCRPRLQASPPTPCRWDDDWPLQPAILPRFPNRPPRPRRPRVGGTMIGSYKRPFPPKFPNRQSPRHRNQPGGRVQQSLRQPRGLSGNPSVHKSGILPNRQGAACGFLAGGRHALAPADTGVVRFKCIC